MYAHIAHRALELAGEVHQLAHIGVAVHLFLKLGHIFYAVAHRGIHLLVLLWVDGHVLGYELGQGIRQGYGQAHHARNILD